MEYILSGFYTVLFILLLRKISFFQLNAIHKNLIAALFTLKILSGIGLSWVYTYYYTDRSTADIFKYFDDSKVMYDALFTKPADFLRMMTGIMNDNTYFSEQYYSKMNHWFRPFASNYYNDTHIIIRFNAFVRLFSFGYFQVHNVFINFISLAGIVAIYRSFEHFLGKPSTFFFVGMSIIPSLLFWGSGVLKEGLLLFGIGFFCYAFFNLMHIKFTVGRFIILILMAYLLMRLKFYVLIAMTGPLLAYWWVNRSDNKKTLARYMVTILLLFGIALNVKYIFPQYDLLKMISQKQQDFICLAEYMDSGSIIEIERMSPTTIGFFKLLPRGTINGFLRPYIWESKSAFVLMNALENLILLLLLLISVTLFRRKAPLNMNLICFSFFFIFILNTVIGLSTPVLGALVRYRVPCLPFLLLIISLIIDLDKFNFGHTKKIKG